MALSNTDVRDRLKVVRKKDVDDQRETARFMNALADLVVWLTERELKEPN